MTEIIERFASLFEGNLMAYGTEEGGCDRPTICDYDELRARVSAHLHGTMPMGIYPMNQPWGSDWMVKWGCIDFDEGEEPSWAHARNCQLLLAEFGVQAHVERSRSKGYHVWVFAQGWVPARVMREALLAAAQIVDAPTREINPKQVELEGTQLGNYVRTPYPGALSNGGMTVDLRRMVVNHDRDTLELYEWLEDVHETDVVLLETLAGLYQPPMKRRPKLDPNAYSPDAGSYLTPYLRRAFEDGPGDVVDRSATLWRFACLLAESGKVPYEAAVELATAYDEKWLAKFTERLDGQSRIEDLVSKAYG